MRLQIVTSLIIALCLWAWPSSPVRADDVGNRIEKPVQEAIATRQATQQDEESWREEREKLLAQHDTLERAIAQLETRKDALQQSIGDTRRRIAAKEQQLKDIEQMSAGIMPLVDEVIQQLDAMVAAGLPFLTAERRTRIERLTQLAKDPEVAISEKFRKVMEALMIEAEYGNTIEVNQETIAVQGQEILTHVFRLGRLSLFYQTMDHRHCGFFNVATADWEGLPHTYNAAIETAIEIGAKRQPVELLRLPLGRMAVR